MMKKNIFRILASLLLALSLVFVMASCDMLPAELQDALGGLLGGKAECTHGNTETVAVNAPTCKAKGTGNIVCSDCGEVLESDVVLDKLTTHTPGEWVVKAEATCVKAGERAKNCTVCSKQIEIEEIPLNASAHSYDFGKCTICKGAQPAGVGLKFEANAEGSGVTLVGIGTCTDTSLVIPSTNEDGRRVTAIKAGAFKENATVKSIIIPDSVTEIGEEAFYGCSFTKASAPAAVLASVKISTLKTLVVTGTGKIPDTAMNGAQALTSVEICEGVTEIGGSAFSGCKRLDSVVMPASLRVIGIDLVQLVRLDDVKRVLKDRCFSTVQVVNIQHRHKYNSV